MKIEYLWNSIYFIHDLSIIIILMKITQTEYHVQLNMSLIRKVQVGFDHMISNREGHEAMKDQMNIP